MWTSTGECTDTLPWAIAGRRWRASVSGRLGTGKRLFAVDHTISGGPSLLQRSSTVLITQRTVRRGPEAIPAASDWSEIFYLG